MDLYILGCFMALGIFCGFIALTLTYILAQTMQLMQDKKCQKSFKIHTINTPRCGGVAILIAFIIIVMAGIEVHYNSFFSDTLYVQCTTRFYEYAGLHLYIASLIVMSSGIPKDNNKSISFLTKLCIQSIGILYFIVLSHFEFSTNNTLYMTTAITCYIFLLFTTNSMNVIDGINGNAAFTFILILASICLVVYNLEGNFIVVSGMLLCGIICIFLLFNYPFGKMFLGDSGAFLLGFYLGALSIIAIWYYNVNILYIFSLFLYPLCEIILNMLVRIKSMQNKSLLKKLNVLLKPNDFHLHFFLYKKFNNLAPLIINMCYMMFIAVITMNNNKFNIIIISSICFCIFHAICFLFFKPKQIFI